MSATSATPLPNVETQLRTLANDYVTYYNRRDSKKLVAMFTHDAMQMAPFAPATQGHEQIRQAFQHDFEQYDPRDLKIEITRTEHSGDIAFEFGTFTMNVRMPDGTRMDDHGKWIVTLRHADDEWRISGHIWNTDLNLLQH